MASYQVQRCDQGCCRGKHIYEEYSYAVTVAQERSRIIDEQLTAYFCFKCSHVHIGHAR